jgi:uncharacterized protein
MHIDLSSKPHAPTIIVGFPGVGLIGPIVTEFLIEHLKTEEIGTFTYDELPPMVPIHQGKIVRPMSVHYSREHNVLIIYTILNLKGQEWPVARAVQKLADTLAAKEVLVIDGANTEESVEKIFCFGNPQLVQLGAQPMQESVVIGVAGALLLSRQDVNCLFAAAHSEMPDSKAAADVVKFLDKYLGLSVDYQPLLEQAQQFEEKLKSVASQAQKAFQTQDKKNLDYLG